MNAERLEELTRGSLAFAKKALGGRADNPAVLGPIAAALLTVALAPDVRNTRDGVVAGIIAEAGKESD